MRKTELSAGSKRRPRRARAAWVEEVEAWRTSGQSATEYADARGLHAGTLQAWWSRLRREARPARGAGGATPRFVPVRVGRTERVLERSPSSGELEVVLGNGRRVRVTGADRAHSPSSPRSPAEAASSGGYKSGACRFNGVAEFTRRRGGSRAVHRLRADASMGSPSSL